MRDSLVFLIRQMVLFNFHDVGMVRRSDFLDKDDCETGEGDQVLSPKFN